MHIGIAISLVIIGIILIFAEIFLLTGLTVTGMLGIAAALAGIYFLGASLVQRSIILLVVALVIGLLCYIGYKTGKLKRAWRKVSLEAEQQNTSGYVAPDPQYERYLYKRGEAMSVLRPAGVALIDGERIDVVTGGEYIKQGTPIIVYRVEGFRIIVREATASELAESVEVSGPAEVSEPPEISVPVEVFGPAEVSEVSKDDNP